MHASLRRVAGLVLGMLGTQFVAAQEYGKPDTGQPGDVMIQQYLRRETAKIHTTFLRQLDSRDAWEKARPRLKQEYLYMLGLWPTPEKTPLRPTITGTLKGDGFDVDMIHYQSRPRLYVTGNLYRPQNVPKGARLPAVLYVCGHSDNGRNGNKTAYQSHGIWFARHGFICLTVDTLQLGEIRAIHHGTYREGRWWWHSRGYTPAGVECWNGIRGIDYLLSRPDVDPDRIAVTGISGGGAATFWIAAADERVRVAVPVSGMADLSSYVSNRVINGHCDCMFLYNTFRWPWTYIAALVAPRPLLFVNSDNDAIFPMDANDRVINRLERVYSFFGAGDRVDSVVSVGGHEYRQDIRQAAFRFIILHLRSDASPIVDSEVDLATGPRGAKKYPIPPEKLRVFPTDADLPRDEQNTVIDQHFVPKAVVSPPKPEEFDSWKGNLIRELRRVSFGCFPERIPVPKMVRELPNNGMAIETEPGIVLEVLALLPARTAGANANRVILLVANQEETSEPPPWAANVAQESDAIFTCSPRGIRATRWTTKNPPNYVERSHALLGRTVDTGRVWDVIAVARYLRSRFAAGSTPLVVAGREHAGILAAYAGLLEPEISQVVAVDPPQSHMDASAPQFLNVLRVCDIHDVFRMLGPTLVVKRAP
jgi:dienelactone hydrolase